MENVLSIVPAIARAKRIRAALDRFQSATVEWVEATLDLANELYEARLENPANQDFGAWLFNNDIYQFLNGKEVQALINIAEHRQVAEDILRTTDRRSFRYIWSEEIEPALRLRSRNEPKTIEPPKSSETTITPAEKTENESSDREKWQSERKKIAIRFKIVLGNEKERELVFKYVLSEVNLRVLSNLTKGASGGAIWNLLVECIEKQYFGEPSNIAVKKEKSKNNISLNLILPWMPTGEANKYDLRSAADRKTVRDQIFPIITKYGRDQTARNLKTLIYQEHQAEERQREQEIKQAQERKRIEDMKPGETQVVAYGETIWPPPGHSQWTYDQACAAIRYCQFIIPQLRQDNSPEANAILIRNSFRYMRCEKGWENCVLAITQAYENNPQGIHRCPPIVNFGL